MLEVLPIQAKIEQEAICARCGIEYDADCMAYRATIDGVLTGICQFSMSDRGGVIRDLATVQGQALNDRDRIESLFVLGRATLNFIDLCGVHRAFFDDAAFLRDNQGLGPLHRLYAGSGRPLGHGSDRFLPRTLQAWIIRSLSTGKKLCAGIPGA